MDLGKIALEQMLINLINHKVTVLIDVITNTVLGLQISIHFCFKSITDYIMAKHD